MSTTEQVQNSEQGYDPNRLLNFIMAEYKLKNDAALARKLCCAPPVISKIRHGRLPVGASLLIFMHEMTGRPVKELREIMGDRRQTFRLSTTANHPMRAKPTAQPVQVANETSTQPDVYHPAMAA